MNKKANIGMVILGVVAIIAIIALVLLLKGGATGAVGLGSVVSKIIVQDQNGNPLPQGTVLRVKKPSGETIG